MIVYFDAQMVPGLASGSSLTLPPVCTHILYTLPYFLVSPVAQMVKNQPVMQETQVRFLGREDSLEKGMATPVFLPGEPHGQGSLAGYSPCGHKESDMTEQLTLYFLAQGVAG